MSREAEDDETNKAGQLSLAGFLAIAIAFGIARNGYGLFLPDFRNEFKLSVELSGLIASGLQAGYLIALSVVGLVVARVGPRLPVVVGGLSASTGMVLVAFAPNVVALAAGVILAGTSAGWSWAPYNDAADRMVTSSLRSRVLSVISTGTTFGIVVAGVLALAAGASWRSVWLVLAVAALAFALLNTYILPGGPHVSDTEGRTGGPMFSPGFGWFVCAESVPLFVAAFCFGIVSAFYWSFAVDFVARSGGFSPAAGPVFYVVLGIAGFVGVFTGDAAKRFGLRRVLVAIFASLCISALSLSAAPGWWPIVGASAALYGANVMLMSALLAIWSSAVFAGQIATGFSATLVLFGAGSVVGPAALGAFAGGFGLGAAFQLAAALSLLAAFIRPAEATRA